MNKTVTIEIIMKSFESHVQECELSPKGLWRSIGGFWTARKLGHFSSSIWNWLGEKANEEKVQFETVVLVQWETTRTTEWDEINSKKQTRIY